MDLNAFKELVKEKLNINVDNVNEDTNITADLGIDSIDVMEIIMNIEAKYDIRLEDDKIKDLQTVKDLLSYVSTLIKK